ncbi:MAG TPA: hypothetical protein PKG82_10440 [Myxococcota bacterium]|nr:hypothetical protein [Myxococcota bacterium]
MCRTGLAGFAAPALIVMCVQFGCGSEEDRGLDTGLVDSESSDIDGSSGLDCRIEGQLIDCSAAFVLTHQEIAGDSARAKCHFVCENGLEAGENGLAGSWCDVACDSCISIHGLTCDDCNLLSEDEGVPQCP